jgi:hypothetical protein
MAGLIPKRINSSDIRDYTWLADYTGMEEAESATLHFASLNAAGTHKLENWIKSGTPLAKITAAGATKGQYGLYTPGETNGLQTHVGFLKTELQLVDPVTGANNDPLTGAVLRFGQILYTRLPVTFDPTAAGANKTQFIYRDN